MTETILAARAVRIDRDDPLAGLEVCETELTAAPDGWVTVEVRAAALNHHDLWTLQGVGISEDTLPITLGCDAAGVSEDGSEVIVHAVIADPDAGDGDETLDPKRHLLSERVDGTLAERVRVPARNLVAKPPELSWEEAACLPTAWLTAYRMLFTRVRLTPGDTVLVQGAGGGVATAAVALGSAAGYRVWVTSRDEAKRERALELGADAAFESGERLPERVDAVVETVGEATWKHSLRSLRAGGTIVVAGATSGMNPPSDLAQVFFLQRSIVGSTMGTKSELERLARFCVARDVRPAIDSVMPLAEARQALAKMREGDVNGKIVLTP